MKKTTLRSVCETHQGKVSDKWALYLEVYDNLFSGLREKEISLLEIGVQNGGSLEIWAKYFQNAKKLVGCDVDPHCGSLRYKDPRITIVIGDSTSDNTAQAIFDNENEFDLIIDDGSHTSGDVIRSFARYFPHLRDGGEYLIEDLHCSYWRSWGGGLFNRFSSIAFFKSLVDVINSQHFLQRPSQLLSEIEAKYGIQLSDELLTGIHSIIFFNSICMITKRAPRNNLLGERIVVGTECQIDPSRLAAKGTSAVLDVERLRDNELNADNRDLTWEKQVAVLDQTLAERDRELGGLRNALTERDIKIARLDQAMAVRDTNLAVLDRTLAEREAKIAALDQAMAERDGRIAVLERALMERDGRITVLDKALAERGAELNAFRQAVDVSEAKVSALQKTILEIYASTSWRISWPLRAVRRLLDRAWAFVRVLPLTIVRGGGVVRTASMARAVLRDEGLPGLKRALAGFYREAAGGDVYAGRHASGMSYRKWVEKYDTLDDGIRAKIRDHIGRLRHKPLISVVMSVYNPNPIHLDETIRSVRMQLYPHWELCIADDASTDREVRQVINRHVEEDSRIKVVYRKTNGHICHATNSALELAHGEFVALLDHDDMLTEHALYWIAAEIETHPDADILYTDSDLLDDSDQRYAPYFKSDFNLELMLGHNMVSHLGVYRRSLIEAVGGMRVGLEGSQDYDLLLRMFAKSTLERVRHIPTVLYHWRRSDKAPTYSMRNLDRCVLAAQRSVTDFLVDRGIPANVMPAPMAPFWQRIEYRSPDPLPKVSIIIPTKNRPDLLERCLRGVLKETDYPSLDVTIVDNDSDDAQTKALLEKVMARDRRVRVIRYSGPFNFSAINNAAVRRTDGPVLALLNDDIEIVHPDWLREMVHRAMRPEVGAVGAKLYFPNGNIQHAGVVLGLGGVAGHLYYTAPRGYTGPFGEALLTREVTAVTAACMVIRRTVFLENGGFDEVHLPVAYNDVDFCLRLRARGYKNVITPFAELIHHESATRGSDLAPERQEQSAKEIAYMRERWGGILDNDPYFSPNYSLSSSVPALAEPPRIMRPWETRT